MKYTLLGLFADKVATLDGYSVLLAPLAAQTGKHLFDDISDSHFLPSYDIVLIDFSTKSDAVFVRMVLERFAETAKIFIISPYSSSDLAKLIPISKNIDAVMQKPLSLERLKTLFVNHTRIIDRQRMVVEKTELFSEIVELNPSFISVFSREGVLFYANTNFMKAFSINAEDIDTITFNEIKRCDLSFKLILDSLQIQPMYIVQREDNGKWYESHFYAILDHYVVHVCDNITEAKYKEQQLEQAAVFFEQSNEALMIADTNGKILSVNAAFCRITGYPKDEVIGRTPHILYSGMHDKAFYENMWGSLVHNGSWQGEIWNRRKNGEVYPEWLSISKATSARYNEDFYISVFTDISSIKETDRKLYFYANHDPLTGLANRVNFESQLKKQLEICKRRDLQIALLFLDLDKFKEINDTYGHTIGDAVLKTVTKRLTSSVRSEDFIARLGGDEFVIIAAGAENTEGILILARKLNDVIKEPITIDKHVFFISLSIGIAIYPEHGANTEDLIKHADAAMYEVKESGRNGFMLYDERFGQKISFRIQTQNELIRGINNDEFELYYQPVINLQNGKVIGAEALIRWHHPNNGLVFPNSFIPIVEEGEYIHEFGKMVYLKAIQDLVSFHQQIPTDKAFHVSVNIAPKQFFETDFVKNLVLTAQDFGIHPSAIELELLETQIMKSPQVAQDVFSELSQHGFKIALDDFGKGYSSLSYLKLFKLNKLKIDQSFVRDMLDDNNDKEIIQTIISMGKIFGMNVHAEGVETKAHEILLKEMGCDCAQGYLYSRPIPLGEFLQWYREYHSA